MDTELDLPVDPPQEATYDPDSKWIAWALWSGIGMVMALFGVFCLGVDSGLLLGWAVGVIVAATLTLFGRE
jgi:hypothetical protein